MKIALLMNQNAYAGREYLDQLQRAGIPVHVISIGTFPEVNPSEEERCGGRWRPKSMAELIRHEECASFPSLRDESLARHLEMNAYELGIQGGTGILKAQVIDAFRLGILNFHPGDLPSYRGCSAPEWQLWDGFPVVSTCHLVDAGIDTGSIYCKKTLDVDLTDYTRMRAGIYPETAKFVAEIVAEIMQNGGYARPLVKQDETKAVYRKYIGQDRIEELKRKLSGRAMS